MLQASPSALASPPVNASPSPSPGNAGTPDKLNPTLVRISPSGLELSGFPTWIIWVLLGVAVAAFLVWFFLLKSDKRPDWLLIGSVVFAGIFLLGVMLAIGSWWGRRSARAELQDLIAAQTRNLASPSQPALAPQASPGSVPQASPSPIGQSTVPSVVASPSASTGPALYMVIMDFALLVGTEMALFMYIYLRWGSPVRFRGLSKARTRDLEEYVVENFRDINRRLGEYRS